MLARLRTLLLKTPVLVALGLVLAWLLFGWFGFGPLAQWGAEKYVADKSGYHLSLDQPKFDPIGLKLTLSNVRLTAPDGKFMAGFKELFVDFEASSLFRFAWTFDAIRLVQPEGNLELLPGGKLNWTPFLDAFKSEDDTESGMPRLLIRHIELRDGQVDFADRTVEPAYQTAFHPLDLTLDDLSTLPDDNGTYRISARTVLGAKLRWKGTLDLKPVVAAGSVSMEGIQLAQLDPYLKNRVAIAPPAGQLSLSTDYRVTYDKKRLGLTLDKMGVVLDGLQLHSRQAAAPAVNVDRLTLANGRFDLASRQVDLGTIRFDGGQVDLARLADGRIDLQNWLPPSAPVQAAPPAKEVPAAPWHIKLAGFDLDKVGIRYRDETFVKPLGAELSDLHVAFKADAEAGGKEPKFQLQDGKLGSGTLTVTSGKDELLQLAGIRVEGVSVDLAARRAGVKLAAMDGGKLTAERAPDGSLPLLAAFKPKSAPAKPSAEPVAETAPAWSWSLDQAELDGWQVVARDRSLRPAAGLTLDNVDASVSGLSQDLKATLPVKLALRVKEGGSLKAEGKLVPAKGQLDAKLDLAGLNLMPAQPYIAQFANVALVSGRAASRGQLTVGSRTRYRGSFRVDNLLLKESRTGDRLLAWRSLSTSALSVSPKGLDIKELKANGLGAKLVIFPDKSTNLAAALKSSPAAPPAEKPAKPAKAPEKPAFRLAIDQISVAAGEMDFADQSLALPFGTRIHGLKGFFDGIGNQPGNAAQLELDGLVDDYGLARAAGQIDLFNPTGFTDVKVVFRNVEMTRLTPYSATFAGRKIASGKLSLDLEYKIKDRQLEGNNQVVMDRLTLGERVESPTAKNLPLDLAIAILQDSDGRIDLGLPVSGSLDDPQFSYGRIIWKAIVNLIGKIALAPFRALGAIFGGGEKLESVVFDAGDPALLPPEKEKLAQVAKILAKRPKLALTVQGGWSPEVDGLAIRDLRVRRALAQAMGRKLGPDEEPGPISLAKPEARDAVEEVYGARFGRAALRNFQSKFQQANPEPPPASAAGRMLSRFTGLFKGKEEPISAEDAAKLKGADLHELLYRQLVAKEPLAEATLVALGKARGEAMMAALAAAGVPAARVSAKAPEAIAGVTGQTVAIKLTLGVANIPAPSPAQPAPPAAPVPAPQPAR